MIGARLEDIQKTFQIRQSEPYRPDLYPTSYEFAAHGAKVQATILEGKCLHAMVAYETAPDGVLVDQLALFSGLDDWIERPSTDSQFEIYFPRFDASRNRFFVEQHETAFSMIQSNVGLGALVLWFSAREYPQMLQAYRARQKGH